MWHIYTLECWWVSHQVLSDPGRPHGLQPTGSSVHRIFQRILELVAISFSIMEYYSAIKRNKIMPFEATRGDLKIIMLSEVRQRKTNI